MPTRRLPILAFLLLSRLQGGPPDTAIFYLPVGYHVRDGRPFLDTHLFGVSHRGWTAGTFRNCFGDFCGFLAVEREVYRRGPFGIGLAGGLVAGYHGALADNTGLPFPVSFLWTGNVSPGLCGHLTWRLSRRLDAQLLVSPLYLSGGLRCRVN